MTRATGAMKARRVIWPEVEVAALYMPSGKTTLHSPDSYVSGQRRRM
jgi:hypothetical protein